MAVFGSGRGSNFQSIAAAIAEGRITDAHIRVVISNNSNAGILHLAGEFGIKALHLNSLGFASEGEFADYVLNVLRAHTVNFIVLAGYMKKLHPRIVTAYRHRIINIHPALLPRYGGKGMYGMRVHQAVLAAKEARSGATVHLVDEEYDHGPIILQQEVAVAPDETPESLAEKVLNIEHEIYPEAVRLFAKGKLVVTDTEEVIHLS